MCRPSLLSKNLRVSTRRWRTSKWSFKWSCSALRTSSKNCRRICGCSNLTVTSTVWRRPKPTRTTTRVLSRLSLRTTLSPDSRKRTSKRKAVSNNSRTFTKLLDLTASFSPKTCSRHKKRSPSSSWSISCSLSSWVNWKKKSPARTSNTSKKIRKRRCIRGKTSFARSRKTILRSRSCRQTRWSKRKRAIFLAWSMWFQRLRARNASRRRITKW